MRRRPQILGLHGLAGAGKDTVFERLQALGGEANFCRFSIADPLKDSISALFGIDLDVLEQLKRDPLSRVFVGHFTDTSEKEFRLVGEHNQQTMREFMDGYGTRSHRGVFGDDFWLRIWLDEIDRRGRESDCAQVNTSVRFQNEARTILECGGEVWLVEGPQDDGAEGLDSEVRLPDSMITRTIDNVDRYALLDGTPCFNYLDDQLALILDEWKTRT